MRNFLDANILFSAAQLQGRMRVFLEVLFERGALLTNDYAIDEARRNLAVKKPSALPELEKLAKRCEIVLRLRTDLDVELPLKDMPILGGAIGGGASHLLTGDAQDFGKFWGKTIHGVKIVSPRLLAEELHLT